MKKLALVMFMALLGTVHACPIKKGYWLNGLVRERAGLMAPVCGALYNTLKGQAKLGAGQWMEAYLLPSSKTSAAVIATLGAAIKEKGYEQVLNQRKGNSLTLGYTRGKNTLILNVHQSQVGLGLTVLGK